MYLRRGQSSVLWSFSRGHQSCDERGHQSSVGNRGGHPSVVGYGQKSEENSEAQNSGIFSNNTEVECNSWRLEEHILLEF